MDYIQFATIFLTFIGLFIWNRTEARTDNRHMDAKLESNRALSESMHRENKELIIAVSESIQREIKDFHGRLCAIEERRNAK